MLRTYDIVRFRGDFEDAEVAGKRGHVIGAVEADQIAVFVYDVERVWCCHPRDVVVTGERDHRAEAEAEAARSLRIRVNQKGEVLD